MNNFKQMDNMAVNYIDLTDQELMEMKGGIISVGVATGLSADVAIGISRNGHK
ncbi:hypothetical protein [Streptococcus sp. zg-JUN1979]|uniref:hypothetical protein n=1 Tax=Streptococcus sp. zg-JUN1979 TaxID=3391450 RepID=UPI0039AFC433